MADMSGVATCVTYKDSAQFVTDKVEAAAGKLALDSPFWRTNIDGPWLARANRVYTKGYYPDGLDASSSTDDDVQVSCKEIKGIYNTYNDQLSDATWKDKLQVLRHLSYLAKWGYARGSREFCVGKADAFRDVWHKWREVKALTSYFLARSKDSCRDSANDSIRQLCADIEVAVDAHDQDLSSVIWLPETLTNDSLTEQEIAAKNTCKLLETRWKALTAMAMTAVTDLEEVMCL